MKRSLIFTAFVLTAWIAPAGGAGFSGQLKSSTDVYPYHLGPKIEDVTPYLIADMTGKLKFSKSFRLQARLFALANPQSDSPPEKLYADAPEGFVEFKSGDLKLRAGMDTVNWGLVDVYSPSDVVNTLALFHPLRIYKRGAPMVEALWDKSYIGFHLLYIPQQPPPLLPSPDSRWLPRRFLLNLNAENTHIDLPPFIEYRYLPSVTLDHALAHNAGAKITSHLGSLDFQVTHFEGASPSPRVIPTVTLTTSLNSPNATAQSPIQLAPLYYRVRTSGFGMTWTRESWIFRAETAYQASISSSPLIQPWMWTGVAAVETNIPVGSTTMTWLAQYYYAENPRSADNIIVSNYRLFDNTAALGTRWSISDGLTVTASALYEIPQLGLFVLAGFEQKLTESLKWGLAWRNFSASRDGLLKTYAYDSHGTMDLTYFF